ncbi:MAG: type II toxin-antitoxin system Phd/YefM family antitoxin [bacterium]|nr:type II toxin-antitoxin system Phd/YefM family antitoxin [bacterium]
MQRTIDVTTARRQFGTLLDEVFYKGDVITIERKGKPLARLVPATAESQHPAQAPLNSERQHLLDQLHSLPTLSMNEDPTEVLRQIRSQRRIRATKNHE